MEDHSPLARLAPRVVTGLIAFGAVGGLILDFLFSTGAFEITGASMVPTSAIISGLAATGMLLPVRLRPLGLAIAVAAGILGTALAATGVFVPPGATELGSLGVLLFGTVRRARPSVATAGVLAVLADLLLMAGGREGVTIYGVPVLWMLALTTAGVGLWARWQDDLAITRATGALREERLALARELHDGIAHHVTGMVVQAQAAQLVLAQRPDAAAQALARIERSGAETMAAMRRVVVTLRTDGEVPLAPAATTADIRAMVADVDAAGPRVQLHMDDALVPTDVVPTVHRVVQESLTNARRHAEGVRTVVVQVVVDQTWVRVLVRDDGRAPTRGPSQGGFGLTGLSERVTALGGHLAAGPAPQGGWEVVAWIPAR